MAENGREIVVDMLLVIEREEEFSHRIINAVLTKYDYLTGQEKAFIKRLFEGTLERRIELDYELDLISNTPVRKMKPFIRNLLRMSAYQLLYMDSVPDAAAVNEAVRLAGKRGFHNLKGFVNGVLRKLASGKGERKLPSKEAEPVRFLSVAYSMPEWLVEHFLASYSYEETERLLVGLLEIRPVTIRFVKRLSEKEREELIDGFVKKGVEVTGHPFVQGAYELKNCENIATLPGFAEGAFWVQDASSMLAVLAAGIRPGDRVLDVCAAPGGKSLLAAEYAGENGSVEARDISQKKAELIEENRDRMGFSQLAVRVWDATVLDESMAESADVVLTDVPCTGLGVMSRKRDIKYRQKKETLEELPLLQKQIVKQAAGYVKPGGVLLYSTCTINPKENEEMVEWISKECGLIPEDISGFVKGLPGQETAGKGYIQLLPGIHGTDGFFFARMRKRKD